MLLDVGPKQSTRQTRKQVRKLAAVPVPVVKRVLSPKLIDETNVSSSEICVWLCIPLVWHQELHQALSLQSSIAEPFALCELPLVDTHHQYH